MNRGRPRVEEKAKFRNVAVPMEIYDMIRDVAKKDDRTIAYTSWSAQIACIEQLLDLFGLKVARDVCAVPGLGGQGGCRQIGGGLTFCE